MAYVRNCRSCGQRISMREMKGRQWVAFDVSTESPHKCGYQTKPDPNIASLGKQNKKKEEPGGIDIGYSEDIPENENPDIDVEEVNSKIEEAKIDDQMDSHYQRIVNQGKIEEKTDYIPSSPSSNISSSDNKPFFGSPGTFPYYFWRGLVIFWVLMFLNGILFGPFD